MEEAGAGALHLVSASSPRRALRDVVEQALQDSVHAADVRHLHGDTFVVFTEHDPSELRDRIAERLADDESAIVVEFERWSSHGPAVDRRWMLRRGH